ncbi:MAG: haloacid dehalogenase [Akkermansiaceae bacterium]|nr:haloacid dehalogenase [Akkermansiaceae bacterium]
MANFSPAFRVTGVKAVAFDLDDTLFDRRSAFQKLLENWLGAPEVAAALPEILAHDQDGRTPRREFLGWLASRFPALSGDLHHRFRHEFTTHIVPDPAALELLAALKKAALPLALLSNGAAAFQLAKLRAAQAASFFSKSHLLFSSSLGLAKPHPHAFAALATRLALPPHEILFVGDDPLRDIAGARSAGFQTCLLARRPGRTADDSPSIASLTGLIPLLNLLPG